MIERLNWSAYLRLKGAAAFAFFVAALFFTATAVNLPHAAAQTQNGMIIRSISPQQGPIGTQVTVYGSGFTSTTIMNFGPGIVIPDNPNAVTPNEITFTIPQLIMNKSALQGGSSSCMNTSTLPSGTMSASDLQSLINSVLSGLSQNPSCLQVGYTPTPAIYSISVQDLISTSTSNSVSFTLTPAVKIYSISPNQGQIGTNVTIYGTGFATSGNAIGFGNGTIQGVIPIMGGSSTILTFSVPQELLPQCALQNPQCNQPGSKPKPGTYNVSVSPELNFSETSNQVPFTLNSGSVTLGPPVITGISQSSGPIGTQIVISGYNFSPNINIIDFGAGITAPQVTGNTLTFTIPQTLLPSCTFFSNPPCTNFGTPVPVAAGTTYQIAVATSRTNESNFVPLKVTPLPAPSSAPDITSSSTIGYSAVSTAPLRVHSAASLSAPVLGIESANSTGTIIDGPLYADGYVWFNIGWNDGLSGWSVTKYLVISSPFMICPVTVGDSVTSVVLGAQGAVVLYVKTSPSLSGGVVGAEDTGASATVMGGPTIADGYTWWQVKFADGVTGWVRDTDFIDSTCISTPNIATPPPSTIGASINFINPTPGETVSGIVPLAVSVSSSFPVIGVSYYGNGALIGTATSSPFSMDWNTIGLVTGSYGLTAVATTTGGISNQTSTVVKVSGINYPTLSFITPKYGATVSGMVPLSVSVSSSLPVTEVDFFIDGVQVGAAKTPPYAATWNSSLAYNGYHTIYALAHTTNPSVVGATAISVIVTGGLPPPPPKALPAIDVSFSTPLQGATVSGSVPVEVTVSSSVSISNVQLFADSKPIGTISAPGPYLATWNASQVLDGMHTLYALATAATSSYTGGRSITVNVTGGLQVPIVTFTNPLSNATVSGQVPLTVSVAATNPAVTEVDFYADNAFVGSSTAPGPYTVPWYSSKEYNGWHTLQAVARTGTPSISGNSSIRVDVTGGLPPPAISITITAPQNATTVFGNVPISAFVSSTIPVLRVDFSAGGTPIGSSPSAPYGTTWNSTLVIPGTYTILATAVGQAMSVTQSVTVSVIAPPIFHAGEKVQAQTDSSVGLNVRGGPSISYSIIGTEANGSQGTILNNIPVIADGYNWWNVRYADGVTGWSVETYLVAAP